MFELYYRAPADPEKEKSLLSCVSNHGGRLDFREAPTGDEKGQSICLTYEFDRLEQADAAAQALRKLGEHVEGPQEYDREPSHAK